MHGHLLHALAVCQFQHRQDLLLVAVHATGREQPEYMQGGGRLRRSGAGADQFGIVEETAVLDRRVHPGQVLVNDATGAQVHVAHFRISHLPLRQAHVAALGVDKGVGTGGQQAAPVGQGGLGQRIVLGLVAMAPAIQDQQDHGLGALGRCGHGFIQ